ncbi:hypothetical protein COO60DRAFT_1496951 [Scenedesmus sp. NREL 46B-D3]|nr:hypothetical protein COO60DRAFT_1496951 [Scenedesmus sp. NREL 46B-D3]
MLQLAAALSDHQQQAQAAADLAAQYTAAADAMSACRMYAECMQACSAAVAGAGGGPSSSGSWIPELLTEVVPAAIDAHLAQEDAAGARSCLTSYNTLLLAAGKSTCDECVVCYEALTGSSAVTLLGCGHIFHRACCNEWFGHKLFEAGRFQAECPLCRQVDESLQPSETAVAALQEIQQYYCEHGQEDGQEESMDEVQSEDEAGQAPGGAGIHSEDEEAGFGSNNADRDDGSIASIDNDDSDDGSSDHHSSDDEDGMDVDSDVGSSVASSALTAVAAQLADA